MTLQTDLLLKNLIFATVFKQEGMGDFHIANEHYVYGEDKIFPDLVSSLVMLHPF